MTLSDPDVDRSPRCTIWETAMTRAWGRIRCGFRGGVSANAERAPPLTDQQIAEVLIRESRQAYHASGHPCAYPEDLARNATRCGARSACSWPRGAEPLCYRRT